MYGKRKKMMYGGMKRKQYNKGGKAGTQPSYSSGEMPKCMPK
tara:strand:- start:605 stop:730 length:126 start_codon:yes stop_codon:yes gene_type:complete